MSEPVLTSYAHNREDIVLWRALGGVTVGRYVEIGANHPGLHSVTRLFYDHGWSGLSVVPDHTLAEAHRSARPRDHVVEAAISSTQGPVSLHRITGSSLSTLDPHVSVRHAHNGREPEDVVVRGASLTSVLDEARFTHGDIHFLVVDVEGAEADVLSAIDLRTWRPWVVVIEAGPSGSGEPTHHDGEPAILEASYELCLFDGVSRFYVATERAAELAPALSYPACAHDPFVDHEVASLRAQLAERAAEPATHRERGVEHELELDGARAEAFEEMKRWRRAALVSWAQSAAETARVGHSPEEIEQLHRALDDAREDASAIRETVSWKVTAPLRSVRRLMNSRP